MLGPASFNVFISALEERVKAALSETSDGTKPGAAAAAMERRAGILVGREEPGEVQCGQL